MDIEALRAAIESLDGEFDLVRELGRGATSIVYLLRDHGLERDVALKVIRGGLGTDEEAMGRLQREAHLVAKLHHPNIVKLYGTHRFLDGTVALMMEHVPGRNLKEILTREGALPAPVALEILKDVASALAYAHRRRIVHRDVKPENIYIDEEVGAARLADFGVARPWDQDSRLTLPGASLGTPAYMSPEQVDGKEVDGRSDVYSLGLVGYEMILGHHPWEGESVFSTIFKQKNEELDMDLPGLDRYPGLAEVLERALKKDPEDRWESAEALLKALQEVVPQRRRDDSAAPDGFTAPETERGTAEIPEGPGRGDLIDWGEIDWVAMEEGGLDLLDEDEDEDEDEDSLETGGLPVPPGDLGETASLRDLPLPSALGRLRDRWSAKWWAGALVLFLSAFYAGFHWLPSSGPEEDTPLDLRPSRGSAAGGGMEAAGPTAGSPSLMIPGGGEIQGTVGSTVTLVARASDPAGDPLLDTLVSFQVVEGEGTLERDQMRTGEGGLAETALRLPTRAGAIVVHGRLSGSDSAMARFQISALPGPPLTLSPILGDGQTAPPGEALADFVGVRVLDEFGNPIPNAPVLFQVVEGEGTVRPPEAQTDNAGRAFARWIMGTSPGPQMLAAVVPGARDSIVTFSATAEMPIDAEAGEEQDVEAEEPLPVRVLPRAFAVGGSQVCRIVRDGTPQCRGGLDPEETGGASTGGLRAVVEGVSHGCGLRADGSAWCWGANESGQLGDGSTEDRASAVQVATGIPLSLMVAGLSHTCALDGMGEALCWGRNLNGQLGDGSRMDRGRPAPVSGELTFESLAAGWNHTCGLTSGGQGFCWGLNGDGQLGDGSRVDRLTPTRIPGTFQSLAAGASHTCGIGETGVLCWGDNSFGQLGTGGTSPNQPTPVPVTGLPSPPTALVTGAVHTCALVAGGSAYCWGQNLHGQLGDGTTENSPRPVPVTGNLRFVALFAGGGVTCGFTPDNAEYCWGMNQGGQLGDGTRTNRSSPTRVRE